MTAPSDAHIIWALKDADLEIRLKAPDTQVAAADALATDVDLDLERRAPSPTYHIMRVRLKNMAAASDTFATMVDIAQSTNESSSSELPVMSLDEDTDVMKILVAAAHNELEQFTALFESKDWRFIMKVWEAANKYEMYIVRASASAHIASTCSASITDNSALEVYTRASMFHDERLAAVVLPEAAKAAVLSLPIQTLGDLPVKALDQLLRAQKAEIASRIEEVKVLCENSPKTRRCPYCGREVAVDRSVELAALVDILEKVKQ